VLYQGKNASLTGVVIWPLHRITTIILVALLIVASFSPSIISAQVAPSPVATFDTAQHRISVSASTEQPKIGHIFYWIEIEDMATGDAVTDAKVKIFAQPPAPHIEGFAWAMHTPQDPGTYTADLLVDVAGMWSFSIVLEDSEQGEPVTFKLEILGDNTDYTLGTITWVIAMLLIIVGVVFISIRVSRQQRASAPR
jgi:hypothetical protein